MALAAWTRDARDLTHDPGEARHYLTIQQLSDAISRSEHTIRDAMARQVITNPAVPRGAICRPAARIGMVPLFAPEQRDEYLRREAVLVEAPRGLRGRTSGLPEYTAKQARQLGMVTLTALAGELGCELNTLRRIGRDHGMPDAVAVAAREVQGLHGRQHELRDRVEVLRWLRDYTGPDGSRGRVTMTPGMLRELARADADERPAQAVGA